MSTHTSLYIYSLFTNLGPRYIYLKIASLKLYLTCSRQGLKNNPVKNILILLNAYIFRDDIAVSVAE